MSSTGGLLHGLIILLEARPSLSVIVLASLGLFWLVVALSAYMLLFRFYHSTRARYRASRALLYRPAVELALMEESQERIESALRPRRWGDADVIQDVLSEAMRHLQGPPFDALRTAALRLGLVARAQRALQARALHQRERAMEALGFLRVAEAVPSLIRALSEERMELKLGALRALAAIGDPAALPAFVAAAETLPPPLLPRLASLALEFGPPGRDAAREIVNRHPRSFPPGVVADLLQALAQDDGGTA